MRLLPLFLMICSFGIICFGVYLKLQHYAIANTVIIGGMASEVIFMIMNRFLMSKNSRNQDK